MQFEVTMRDGETHQVEAAYLEISEGPAATSYTLLGPVPGFPTAIVAAFPAELVHAIMPVKRRPMAQRRIRAERGPLADERAPITPGPADDLL